MSRNPGGNADAAGLPTYLVNPPIRPFLANPPHFHKTILIGDAYIKMGISKKFLDKHAIVLDKDHVYLQMPSGTKWIIGITNSPDTDTVWLDDGWKRFTKFYSVLVGQTIVFSYIGNCSFFVLLFEHDTGFEIDYPIPDTPHSIIDARFQHHHVELHRSSIKTKTVVKGQSSGLKGNKKGNLKSVIDLEMEGAPRVNEAALQKGQTFALKGMKKGNLKTVIDMVNEGVPMVKECIPMVNEGAIQKGQTSVLKDMKKSNLETLIDIVMEDASKVNEDASRVNEGASRVNESLIQKGQTYGLKGIKKGNLKTVIDTEMEGASRVNEGASRVNEDEADSNPQLVETVEEGLEQAEVHEQTKKTSLEQAEAFKSKFPYFIAVIGSTFYRVLVVPATFAKLYFFKPTRIKLSVSDGRNWDAECSHDENLSIFWNNFVRENKLNLGDVCAFELIRTGSRPEIKVTVFQDELVVEDNQEESTGETTSSSSKMSEGYAVELEVEIESPKTNVEVQSPKTATKSIKKNSSATFQKAEAFKSSYPVFAKLMQKTYVFSPYDLSLPVSFSRQHFEMIPKSAKLCIPEGKVWDVKWFFRGVNFTQGFSWQSFVIDNRLVEGDACAFELLTNNAIDPMLRVNIFRKSDDILQPPSSSTVSSIPRLNLETGSSNVNIAMEREPPTALERTRAALGRARAFKCDNPFFIVTLNSTYLMPSGTGLYVPLKFVRKHMDHERLQGVSLKIGDGNEKWDVNRYYDANRKEVIYLSWKQFAADNNLNVGDVCLFEMIDKNVVNPVLKVVIFWARVDGNN